MMPSTNPPPAGVPSTVERTPRSEEDARRYDPHVVAESSRVEGDWVYLVIAPHRRNGLGAYQFASILGRLESRVRDQLPSTPHVLLMPASGVVNP